MTWNNTLEIGGNPSKWLTREFSEKGGNFTIGNWIINIRRKKNFNDGNKTSKVGT